MIENVIINGKQKSIKETVIIYGEIKIKKNYSEEELNIVIKNLYSTNLFKNVDLTINQNNLIVNLEEYPVLNQLIIIGEKSNKFKDEIKKVMQLKEKRSFIKSFLANDLEKIKDLYSSLGYNFSKVEAKLKEIDPENFDLIIDIERGNKTKIKKLIF